MTEAAGFNPEADVQKLREAMKGAGESGHRERNHNSNVVFSHFPLLLESLKVSVAALVAMATETFPADCVLCARLSNCLYVHTEGDVSWPIC